MSNLLNRLEQRVMPTKDVPICLDLNLLTERDKAMAQVASVYNQTKNEQQANDERMAAATRA